MPDVAEIAAQRKPLPFTTRAGDTVTEVGGRIYLNARPISPVDALDLSAALAVAVIGAAEQHTPNHTNPDRKEVQHG